jgi:hypothetical protein
MGTNVRGDRMKKKSPQYRAIIIIEEVDDVLGAFHDEHIYNHLLTELIYIDTKRYTNPDTKETECFASISGDHGVERLSSISEGGAISSIIEHVISRTLAYLRKK